jgi:transcriptional regulator with XRE-family HTH domain
MTKIFLDSRVYFDIIATMRKTVKFQRLVSANRKTLREHGFHPSTVSMWAMGERTPLYETALKIAKILGVDIKEIPYYRIERNR